MKTKGKQEENNLKKIKDEKEKIKRKTNVEKERK